VQPSAPPGGAGGGKVITVKRSTVVSALLSSVVLFTTASVLAAGVTFAHKAVNIAIGGGTVIFHVANVENDSKRATGLLRLELWASSSPFGDDATGAPPMDFKLAQVWLGVLQGEIPTGDPNNPYIVSKFTNIITAPLPVGTPPDGTWYYVVFVTEFTGVATDDGFSVDDWAVMPDTVTVGNPSAPPVIVSTAVEYFNGAWGYYFVTASANEIAALDAGAFDYAWQRTGETFAVWSSFVPGSAATCRFFSDAFAPKSTHFYTPYAAECNALKANPGWQYEGIAFYTALPDTNGLCATGTVPLYRAYDNGIGGAPNHRFTTSFATLQQMIAAGWSFEGNGNTQAFACVPQ
jgi:hypothetical protein